MRIKFFPIFFFLLLGFVFLIFPATALAAGEEPATFEQLTEIFGSAVSAVAIIGGFLSFIALIIGGFRYITARGDPKAIAAAQGMITWAVVGLGMIIISWLILKFIADFTGLPLTTFQIMKGV